MQKKTTKPKQAKKQVPPESEVFCDTDGDKPEVPMLGKVLDYFENHEVMTYELPCVFWGAGKSQIDAEFEYLGTVGNNTKLQFCEIHGDWTVTLAPAQLLGVINGKYGRWKRMGGNW